MQTYGQFGSASWRVFVSFRCARFEAKYTPFWAWIRFNRGFVGWPLVSLLWGCGSRVATTAAIREARHGLLLRRGRLTQLVRNGRVPLDAFDQHDSMRASLARPAPGLEPLRFGEDLATFLGAQRGVVFRVVLACIGKVPDAAVGAHYLPTRGAAARWRGGKRCLLFILHDPRCCRNDTNPGCRLRESAV